MRTMETRPGAEPEPSGAAQAAVTAPPTPSTPAPPQPAVPASNGSGGAAAVQSPPREAARRPRRGGKRKPLLMLGGVLALAAALVVGGRWWYDSVHYVSTDNAQVGGFMVQVGTLDAGRVATVRFDVGDRVVKDDVVATLNTPLPVGTTSSGAPRLDFQRTLDTQVEVRSPISGIVVARSANPGDTVPIGQTILTVVDPNQLWITANIDERQSRRVRPGQRVTITVDALGKDVEGRVAAITQATAATFSMLPSKNVSGNYTREVQYVPVKIVLIQPEPRLVLGSSVEVAIRVVE